jgi:hypothetical protein
VIYKIRFYDKTHSNSYLPKMGTKSEGPKSESRYRGPSFSSGEWFARRCSVSRGWFSELRIHYGPGYRIYFKQRGQEIVILLCGGNKNTQNRDIRHAKHLAKDWMEHDD